ncbi:MAG: transcription antitermination factor NusB [Actinomycetota bacterium]
MGTRRSSRTLALDVLYEREVSSAPAGEILKRYENNPGYEFAAVLVNGVLDNLTEVDALIAGHARDWSPERMPLVDRSLLRVAVFEILKLDDVPAAVSINEAVQLAKDYSTEDSSRFVNGLLSAVLAGLEKDRTEVEPPV